MATNFNVVQLAGITAASLTGPQGYQGNQGYQGATGPGAGAFEVDTSGDLMPTVAITADSYYSYDGNGDLMPAP